MTELQEKIIDSRKHRLGIKSIANRLNCNPDYVKEICKRYGYGGVKAKHHKAKGNKGKQLTMRECIICRQLFVPTHGRQKYCSTSCATYLHWKGKEAYRYKIDLGILYRRDGGICHICGKLCDWNDFTIMEDGSLKVGANYPTRDHLIPKSKGGEHSYENIKLAHHRCNSLRAASGT